MHAEAPITHTLASAGAETTARMGEALARLLRADDVVTLTGDLGAGKTCLVQGVARGLGVSEPVTSPTFNILLVHEGRLTLNHLDLYRLERAGQLEDIDFAGVLESGGVSFVEWGERFPEELPSDHLIIAIRLLDDGSRVLELRPSGPRSGELAGEWSEACGGTGAQP